MQEAASRIIDKTVEYRPMEPSDIEGSARCFAESFQREPMVKCLRIGVGQFLPFAKACCELAVKQQMGLVAVNLSVREVAGFTILQDAMEDAAFDLDLCAPLLPIFAMLGTLQNDYLTAKKITQKGIVVTSFVTGVAKQYQGSKVAHQLFGQSIQLAQLKGYKVMITEVTGRFSQNGVRRRYAFNTYSSSLYKDFVFEGKRVFEDIDDDTLSCMLMEKYFT